MDPNASCLWHWVYHIRLEQACLRSKVTKTWEKDMLTGWHCHRVTVKMGPFETTIVALSVASEKPFAEPLNMSNTRIILEGNWLRNGVQTGTGIYIYIHTYCTRSIYIYILTWWPIHTFKHRQYPNCQHLKVPQFEYQTDIHPFSWLDSAP